MRFWLAAMVLSVPAHALGESPPAPPDRASDAIEVAPESPEDRVRLLRLGSFTASFEQTPLEEIQSQAGAGASGARGDAAESIRWLCYSTPRGLIWLVSGPLGGGDDRLTEVVAEVQKSGDPRVSDCPALPDRLRPVSLEFGWLGTAESDLHQRLGEPSGRRAAWQLFYFKGKTRGPWLMPDRPSAEVDFDVTAYVEAKVEGGKVTALRASHLTTY